MAACASDEDAGGPSDDEGFGCGSPPAGPAAGPAPSPALAISRRTSRDPDRHPEHGMPGVFDCEICGVCTQSVMPHVMQVRQQGIIIPI